MPPAATALVPLKLPATDRDTQVYEQWERNRKTSTRCKEWPGGFNPTDKKLYDTNDNKEEPEPNEEGVWSRVVTIPHHVR